MHPMHHAESSARKFGGRADDYLKLHEWMDVIWTVKPLLYAANSTITVGQQLSPLCNPIAEKQRSSTCSGSVAKLGQVMPAHPKRGSRARSHRRPA